MTSLIRSWFTVGLLALAPSPGAFAAGHGTPDRLPPAVEEACTGMIGAAFGLCVAFCEANDCDLYPDSQACDVLRENYSQITGEFTFPCEGAEEE
jgi:hypothetical protein